MFVCRRSASDTSNTGFTLFTPLHAGSVTPPTNNYTRIRARGTALDDQIAITLLTLDFGINSLLILDV